MEIGSTPSKGVPRVSSRVSSPSSRGDPPPSPGPEDGETGEDGSLGQPSSSWGMSMEGGAPCGFLFLMRNARGMVQSCCLLESSIVLLGCVFRRGKVSIGP